uniref:Large ribosomal subunit protein mL45 n=1 Tax=Alona affinis TaxID=381656 RepID=A0A9N6WWJ5_9CRUS|nr:EOG090X0DDP [Alona affinis]
MPLAGLQQVRYQTKHYDPKFRKLRRLKVQKIKLPNFNEKVEEFTPDQIRARMKEQGMLPTRPWQERPVFISSTGSTFEPYVPPEGDGKHSKLSKAGAKQSLEMVSKTSASMMAIRKIRKFEEDFKKNIFVEQAQEIYIEAHTALAKKDEDTLHQYVTELCYPIMTQDLEMCTVRWQFLKSLEPPQVVHARCTDIISKDNVFAQVTVRFHTQQILAVYDRFGRLMYGSEVIAKDVLEYVVFEKHLANMYGSWRIHEKIIPDWMPPREPAAKTYVNEVSPAEPEPDLTAVAVPVAPADKNPPMAVA